MMKIPVTTPAAGSQPTGSGQQPSLTDLLLAAAIQRKQRQEAKD